MMEKTDAELILLFKIPEKKIWVYEQLVNRHQQKAYYYIRKLVIDHDDTNDVCQDVFVKVWKNLHNFKGESKFTTWLYRICTNESLDHLKRKKRHYFQRIDEVQHELTSTLNLDPLYSGDEIRKKLDLAVLKLPNKQRIIFILKYFEEKKYSEIAQITGTSEGALKASYHHAVKKIEELLRSN